MRILRVEAIPFSIPKGSGKLAHMNKFPLHQGTIYLERVAHLRKLESAV